MRVNDKMIGKSRSNVKHRNVLKMLQIQVSN